MAKRIFMLLSLGSALLLASCGHKEEPKEVKTAFLVTNPIIKDTVVTRDYVAQIQSFRHIELRALEKGYLQKIYVDEGQFVKQGQILYKAI
jgi:membrane fusion protein (multidrug efflux system)